VKTLDFSPDLKLPIDAATQTFAFIGRKGSGKTYAAGKLVEELIDAKVQCVILDTVGNWYGLRLAADGKKPSGLEIPLLGGLRGDIPLKPEAGHMVADLVTDTGRSIVLDLSQFSFEGRRQFATAFGRQLWQRKKA
jgi:DNA helicase HerA-like ATPase